MEGRHGSCGYQSGDSGGTGAEYSGGGRAAPGGTDQRGDQPQARYTEELRELHPADPGKTQLLAARSGNGTISAGLEDFKSRRRRAGKPGHRRRGTAVYEVAGGEDSSDGAPGGLGPGRSGLHREGGGARIFQGEYMGGAANVFAFHERREMPAGLAAEA